MRAVGWSCQGSQSRGFLAAMYAYLGDMGEGKKKLGLLDEL